MQFAKSESNINFCESLLTRYPFFVNQSKVLESILVWAKKESAIFPNFLFTSQIVLETGVSDT